MKQSLPQKEQIKSIAHRLGFQDCGFAAAGFLEEEARYLEGWLNQQKHGTMSYMANHFEKRTDPRLLLPGAKTVISLSYNYFTQQKQESNAPKIARYAYGDDYHKVVKDKLFELVFEMKALFGDFSLKCCVDSVPILEKAWAKRAGVGWIGKHTNLLTKAKGSWFFLAEIICDLSIEPDLEVKDYCSNCTKCIDACPTAAITAPYKLDASKCISYATIELKDNMLPESFEGKMENWMFGCDICQEVCPINARATPHNETAFNPSQKLLDNTVEDWSGLTEHEFDELFKKSAVSRTKFAGLSRNIRFLLNHPKSK